MFDADGSVLYDDAAGAGDDLEDLIHEVGIEYLDLLLEITGEDYFGWHDIEGERWRTGGEG